MKRIITSQLPEHAGKKVLIKGWLHKKRTMGGINFLIIRDRGGITQVVTEDETQVEKLRGLQIGTVLQITGNVVEEPRAKGGVEIHDPEIEVLVPVTSEPPIEIDKPLSHKSDNLDTLFENRVVGLRNLQEAAIFRVRAALLRRIREFLTTNDFVEIQTPKLVGGATEGGAEIFKLDYFGQEATMAQSPQLYKQIMVGVFERVFEVGPVFRAEPSMTTRHMSEITMLDIEMGFIENHGEILKMTESLVYDVLTKTYEDCGEQLKTLNAPPLVLTKEFPRFTVAEVHEMYFKATKEDVRDEKDLIPAEERWICNYSKKKHQCEAVFVTDFPVEAMKFYHMINPDNPETVLWGDLLFRGVEIATAPQREHHLEKLIAQIKAAGMDPAHPGYRYYLQAFEYGLPPHGGFGFGVDRLVQKVIGLNNVKEATLFPRDMNRLTP